MAGGAVGEQLEQHGAFTGPAQLDGLAGGFVDRQHIVAIHRLPGDAVAVGAFEDRM